MPDRPRKHPSRRLAALTRGSLILSLLDRFSLWVQRQAREGLFGYFFTRYRAKDPGKSSSLFIRSSASRRPGEILRAPRVRLSRQIENSLLLSLPQRGIAFLRRVSLQFYGLTLFFYALCVCAGSLLRSLLSGGIDLFSRDLWAGAAMLILSLPACFSRRAAGNAICSGRFSSAVLFGLLGLRRASFRVDAEKEKTAGRPLAAALLGVSLGMAGVFVSPFAAPLAFFGGLGAYAVLCFPETGVTLLFLLLPFLPTMPLGIFTLFVCFSYAGKLLRSKRTLKLEPIDWCAGLFGLLTLFGGIVSVSKGSLRPALMFCCFLTGYFLTVNLLRTREWVERAMTSLVLSTAGAALIGVYQQVTGDVSTVWQDETMFSDIGGRVVSTFGNPNVFGEFLILTIPLLFAFFLRAKGKGAKFASLLPVGLSCVALLYTWSRGAWIGLVAGVLVFFLLYSRRALPVLAAGAVALPFAIPFLPASVLNRIGSIGNLSDSSTAYRVYIWQAAARMFTDHAAGGVGVGEAAFAAVYPGYALAGIESAPHSHNLYLQIGIELGLPALLIFLIFLVLLTRGALTLSKSEDKNERAAVLGALAGIAAVLTQGMTDYVWYNYRVFFAFWLVCGLTSAMAKNGVSPPDDPLSGEWL